MSMLLAILGISSIYVGTLLFFKKRYDEDVSKLNEEIDLLKNDLKSSVDKCLNIELDYLILKNKIDGPKSQPVQSPDNKVIKKRGRRPGWNRNK